MPKEVAQCTVLHSPPREIEFKNGANSRELYTQTEASCDCLLKFSFSISCFFDSRKLFCVIKEFFDGVVKETVEAVVLFADRKFRLLIL